MKKQAVRWAITLVLLAGLMAALWPQPAEAAPSRWRFQSIWVPSITLWKGDKYWVDLMNVKAAGDLDIKWFAGGTLVTRSDEMFDAVAKGTIEAGTDWPSYWEGKNTAFGLITSTPVWLTPGDYMIWFWQAGGMGAAGRDFHNFNTFFRGNKDYDVVAFTATQIGHLKDESIQQNWPVRCTQAESPSTRRRNWSTSSKSMAWSRSFSRIAMCHTNTSCTRLRWSTRQARRGT